MNKTKIILATLAHVALAIFFMVAIWPTLQGSNDGYMTKTAEDIVKPAIDPMPEPAVEPEPIPDVVEPSVDPVSVPEVVEPVIEPASETNTARAAEEDALYSVVEGNKLDANSYAGFKLYRNWCARCHGTYGQGMVGPNLAESLNIISKEEFFTVVENGKSGSIGSMPAWKANPKVMAGRDQLYAYLMARADGAIGVEKPKKQ